uniref:Uncharacterized protein n=1 Tax=Anguilla anguilla TaxID=7936 RepID=A0A0E9V2J1_ANGAN
MHTGSSMLLWQHKSSKVKLLSS